MRISHLSISNFKGIETLAVTLPPVALITGDNGAGKSSLLGSISYAYDSGHDPDVIRTGSEAAEVTITHDDGSQVRVRASRKSNETTRGYKAPGAARFVWNRKEIDRIARAVSYDPLAFLEKTEKEQLATILDIMPIKVEESELKAAIGEASPEATAAQARPDANGLDTIRAIEKAIYDARRDRNVAADTQEKHAAQLEAAIGPAAPDGQKWDGEAARLRSEIQALQSDMDRQIKELGSELQALRDREATTERTESDAAEKEYTDAVAAAERRRADRKAAAKKKSTDAVEHGRTIANAEAGKIKAEIGPKVEALAVQCATAEERARAEIRSDATRKDAAVARQHAAADRDRSKVLTAALERLGALRELVGSRLKIKGIRIEDGRILDIKGVPFPSWNEEAQIIFALKIAVMAHADCGFIVVDKSNGVVGMKWEGVLRTAKKYAETEGIQFVIARAEPGKALTVEEVK